MSKKVFDKESFLFYPRGITVQADPSLFNGSLRVRKYRITVEEVEEPAEVIEARVHALWAQLQEKGSHGENRLAIIRFAEANGIKLDGLE